VANNKTDFLEAAIINHVLRNVEYVRPTTVYVGLFTVAAGETGGGTEVSGGSYARQAITFAAPSQVGGGAKTTNSGDITFPTASGDWGACSDMGIFDAVSGGNLLYFGPLDVPKTVLNGDTIKFSSGQLAVTEF
jgi:hypothetical protein